LTTNQHICVSDIAPEDVPQIKQLLAEYKLDNLEYSGLRLASSACVAFPTCGSSRKSICVTHGAHSF
jgi:sulfite reductase (NADPH) hemoprotein beta-component